jgi:rhodanese-related sulfurtransferase
MKRFLAFSIAAIFVFGNVGFAAASAAKDDLRANEKGVHKGFTEMIPADRIINVAQFKKAYDDVMAGKKKAWLIDVRSHPEFYAFHIEGTDHVHAGHVYTIPKKIKDPNAEIYIYCRTSHRAKYVAGFLYKYGYKNVYCYTEGVVGWAKAGYPFVNQFTGKFKILEYRKTPSEKEMSYRWREFHPY